MAHASIHTITEDNYEESANTYIASKFRLEMRMKYKISKLTKNEIYFIPELPNADVHKDNLKEIANSQHKHTHTRSCMTSILQRCKGKKFRR